MTCLVFSERLEFLGQGDAAAPQQLCQALQSQAGPRQCANVPVSRLPHASRPCCWPWTAASAAVSSRPSRVPCLQLQHRRAGRRGRLQGSARRLTSSCLQAEVVRLAALQDLCALAEEPAHAAHRRQALFAGRVRGRLAPAGAGLHCPGRRAMRLTSVAAPADPGALPCEGPMCLGVASVAVRAGTSSLCHPRPVQVTWAVQTMAAAVAPPGQASGASQTAVTPQWNARPHVPQVRGS